MNQIIGLMIFVVVPKRDLKFHVCTRNHDEQRSK